MQMFRSLQWSHHCLCTQITRIINPIMNNEAIANVESSENRAVWNLPITLLKRMSRLKLGDEKYSACAASDPDSLVSELCVSDPERLLLASVFRLPGYDFSSERYKARGKV